MALMSSWQNLSEEGSEAQAGSTDHEYKPPESESDACSEMDIMLPTPQAASTFTSVKVIQSETVNSELPVNESEPNQPKLTDQTDEEHDEEKSNGSGEAATEDGNEVDDEEGSDEDNGEYESWMSYYRKGKGSALL